MLRRLLAFMFFIAPGSFAYAQSNSPTVWRATEMANSPAASLTLVKRIGGDPVAIIEIRRVRTLLQIQRKIEPLAGRSAELLIVEGKEPNAFSMPRVTDWSDYWCQYRHA